MQNKHPLAWPSFGADQNALEPRAIKAARMANALHATLKWLRWSILCYMYFTIIGGAGDQSPKNP